MQAASVIGLPAEISRRCGINDRPILCHIHLGTIGIILICKYLPRWGVDARAAAKQYEAEFGVVNVDASGLSGYRPFGLRAYRLENQSTAGQSIESFSSGTHPEYRIVNVARGDQSLGADPHLTLQVGDIVALGGHIEALTEKMGLIGPEIADQQALNIPLDQAVATRRWSAGNLTVVPRRAVCVKLATP